MNLQETQGLEIYKLFFLIFKVLYPFLHRQTEVTAKDSADGVLGDIATAGATAAYNIANFLPDGCGLTRAGADLQGLENLGNGNGPIHVVERTSDSVSTGRPAYAGGASNQSRRLPKEDADQIKKRERPFLRSSNERTRQSCQIRGIKSCSRTRVW